ncbi:hypothetical protein LOK49_LG07G00413 [Camellia lanceoleosa]|uniref:Uncharacterized protein n=1 Tax=Camellia lanceoleosa TaxID=1840588 RepID=A0ACC0H4R6_9ERIC|nr:hypothetical protein LOK49_LG07G00413 [Camellia lanceoleosa]
MAQKQASTPNAAEMGPTDPNPDDNSMSVTRRRRSHEFGSVVVNVFVVCEVTLIVVRDGERIVVIGCSNYALGWNFLGDTTQRNAGGIMTDSTKGKSSSTRLALRRQSKLSFKNKKPRSVGVKNELRRAVVDPSKLMYRSNMAGVIKTVSEVLLGEAHIFHLQKTPFG